jgi:hypothetical protein
MGRGNSPFWYEYGQSRRRGVVIGKASYRELGAHVDAGIFLIRTRPAGDPAGTGQG